MPFHTDAYTNYHFNFPKQWTVSDRECSSKQSIDAFKKALHPAYFCPLLSPFTTSYIWPIILVFDTKKGEQGLRLLIFKLPLI